MAYEKSTSERRPALNTVLSRLYKLAESENIAEDMDAEELSVLGRTVCEEYQIDCTSREKWEEIAKKSMDAALQVKSPKNYPFANASNIKWPLITVAALQFNARCYPEIVGPEGVVGSKVKGGDDGVPQLDEQGQPVVDPQTGEPVWAKEPGAKAAKAERVKKYMDSYIMEDMAGWEEDVDTLTIQLPIVGDVVKKVYAGDEVCVSEMIPAMDFVVNQKTKSLRSCPRMTHVFRLYPYEIDERRQDGRFLDVDIPEAETAAGDKDAPIEFLEQHRRIDQDGDGYGEPYIVTVHKATEKVVRVIANFTQEGVTANDKRVLKITPEEYFINYTFFPDPEGGFYGVGFGHFLASIGAAIDTTINQMLDAGHLQNAGGGFIGSGVRLKKSTLRMEPGVYHQVPASGDNLRNAIVNMEHPGPSAVLFNLLGLMMEVATDITSIKDITTGESPQGETATTTLARIEQGMKVFTAIYKRIYRAGKSELKLIYKFLAEHIDEEKYANFMDEANTSMQEDFNLKDYDICPQADPRLVTDMQRLKRAEALLATAELNPSAIPEILRRYYQAIGAEDVDKLLVQPEPGPMDQLQIEGAAAEVGKTKAEIGKVEAETEETLASIEQENARLALEGLKAVDEQQQADDTAETEKTGMVLGEARAEKDRTSAEVSKDKDREAAKEQAKVKQKAKA